jgi:hypothetical protein
VLLLEGFIRLVMHEIVIIQERHDLRAKLYLHKTPIPTDL